MKIILSYIIPEEIENYFKEKGLEIIKTKPFCNDNNSVLMHPDIQCFSDKNEFFTYNDLEKYYIKNIEQINISECTLKSDYPNDVRFNVFKAENYIFCNKNFLDEKLLVYLEKNYSVINVKQGYSNCSSLYLGNKTIATSDKGMEKIFNNNGFKTIIIDNKNIILKGYQNGFIGGSAFKLNNEFVFFGNIDIPVYEKITSFLKENKVIYKCFDFPLEDFGSAVIVEN